MKIKIVEGMLGFSVFFHYKGQVIKLFASAEDLAFLHHDLTVALQDLRIREHPLQCALEIS